MRVAYPHFGRCDVKAKDFGVSYHHDARVGMMPRTPTFMLDTHPRTLGIL
jgi:hypothetical protein